MILSEEDMQVHPQSKNSKNSKILRKKVLKLNIMIEIKILKKRDWGWDSLSESVIKHLRDVE